jgi:hypothetical protein
MNTSSALATLTWQRVIILLAMLVFSAFVLWLTASSFDASEVKSLLMLAAGFVIREFLPIVRTLLGPADAYTRGGRVE